MRSVRSFLWLAMAACLLAGGVLLLIGCDFAMPSFLNFRGAFCPKKADLSGLRREQELQDGLLGMIHEAQLRLAGLPDCRPPPPPGPQPGKRGRLEVTLWWESKDDLDLWVKCPSGDIRPNTMSTKGPGICGDGVHDVDANRNKINSTMNPSEHIVWTTEIPDFLYRVYVHPHSTTSGNSIPYRIRVDFDGESVTCSGQVQWDGHSGVGYAQYPIEFTPTHPLPACVSSNKSLRLCDSPDCRKD
jgi:hypothetical protein